MEAGFTREIRLGLVMYGGASLGVYENGICQEVFRAVKGEGVYGRLKHVVDSEIFVDILSGTSAGGINAILLAYALANGRDFRTTAALWREQADISRLIRSPGDPNTLSVFDGESYFQSALEKALQEMPDYGDNRYGSEIDLFVTGTHVEGQVSHCFDALGRTIPIKDHRSLFVLSYRGDRKNEFAPGNVNALAKLARITSCFPVAFAPVHIGGVDETERLLRRWGRLDRDANFLDGGILDNKPFSSVIDAISGRISDRGSDRLLLYVEPAPERFLGGGSQAPPAAIEAAKKALLEIPRYRSIARDWEAIAAHNRAAENWRGFREAVGNVTMRPSRAEWRMYLRARRADACGEVNFRRRRLAHTISVIQSRQGESKKYDGIRADLKEQLELLEIIRFSIQSGRTEWMPLPRTVIPSTGKGTLLSHSDRQERTILRKLKPGDPVREEYRNFIFLDALLFPMENLAGLTAKEFIRTIRISPQDPEKVRGRKLGHFAAFFSESARAHDILQGRLDGAAQLIECILLPARARGIGFTRDLRMALIREAQREIMAQEAEHATKAGETISEKTGLAILWRGSLAVAKVLWGSIARAL